MQESKSPSVARRGAIYICLTSKNERDPLLSLIVRMSVRMSQSPEALHGLCILDAFHPSCQGKSPESTRSCYEEFFFWAALSLDVWIPV